MFIRPNKKATYFFGGVLLGLSGGAVAGWFLRDRRAQAELQALADEDQAAMSDLIENYEAVIENAAEEKAKEMLLEAARKRMEASQTAVGTTDESGDSEDSEAVEPPKNGSESPSEGAQNPEYKPDPGVFVNRNAFDNQPDPTQAVDYTRYYRDQADAVIYGAKMLNDSRTTTGFSRSKTEVREDLNKQESQSDLLDWLNGHTPDGYRIDGSGMEDPDDVDDPGLLNDDEKAQIDGELENELRNANAPFQLITEDDYSMGCRSHDKSFVMYCEGDDTWCDEDLQPIEDPHTVYGYPECSVDELFKIGGDITGECDRFYIRNNRTGTDYEVMRYHRRWQDMIEDPR